MLRPNRARVESSNEKSCWPPVLNVTFSRVTILPSGKWIFCRDCAAGRGDSRKTATTAQTAISARTKASLRFIAWETVGPTDEPKTVDGATKDEHSKSTIERGRISKSVQ